MLAKRTSLGLAALAVVAIMCLSTTASAQIPFDVGVTIKGGPNVSGITEPSTANKKFSDSGCCIAYPGWVGVSGGVGLFVEPRVLDLVGLEIGMLYSAAKGTGEINNIDIPLTSSDLIFPVHARLATPGLVKFVLSVGLDFIVPLSAEADAGVANVGAVERDLATYLGYGIGLEIDAGPIRIPVEFRGRWSWEMGNNLDDRLESFSPYVLKANWEYQGEVMIGVKYVVDVL